MRITGVKAGDVVSCDVRGRLFYALVLEHHGKELEIVAITAGITYTSVTARQVEKHYRKTGRPR